MQLPRCTHWGPQTSNSVNSKCQMNTGGGLAAAQILAKLMSLAHAQAGSCQHSWGVEDLP